MGRLLLSTTHCKELKLTLINPAQAPGRIIALSRALQVYVCPIDYGNFLYISCYRIYCSTLIDAAHFQPLDSKPSVFANSAFLPLGRYTPISISKSEPKSQGQGRGPSILPYTDLCLRVRSGPATDQLFAHPTTDGNLAPLTPSSFQTNPLFLTVADRNDTHLFF
ncbi:hypothetical protein LX32DRAFT_174564 [Colletotrichum zoysiae]|uniref:Uncharacterized protein n=1 Tax=Colletotrichum zoysiae TaxID=1216348 RepID=A0AAD9H5Y3_9PEZI|nr:hypothetical protein LX32DRAFT_174564 [Colletotrichum zoysiae]